MTLTEYRTELGWSQAELARQAGISNNTVGKAEKGESINGRSAILICKALSKALNRQINVGNVSGWHVNI